VGEWISILEEMLTLGTEVMNYPAFYVILQNQKLTPPPLNQTIKN